MLLICSTCTPHLFFDHIHTSRRFQWILWYSWAVLFFCSFIHSCLWRQEKGSGHDHEDHEWQITSILVLRPNVFTLFSGKWSVLLLYSPRHTIGLGSLSFCICWQSTSLSNWDYRRGSNRVDRCTTGHSTNLPCTNEHNTGGGSIYNSFYQTHSFFFPCQSLPMFTSALPDWPARQWLSVRTMQLWLSIGIFCLATGVLLVYSYCFKVIFLYSNAISLWAYVLRLDVSVYKMLEPQNILLPIKSCHVVALFQLRTEQMVQRLRMGDWPRHSRQNHLCSQHHPYRHSAAGDSTKTIQCSKHSYACFHLSYPIGCDHVICRWISSYEVWFFTLQWERILAVLGNGNAPARETVHNVIL